MTKHQNGTRTIKSKSSKQPQSIHLHIFHHKKNLTHCIVRVGKKSLTVHSGLNFYALGVGSCQKTNKKTIKRRLWILPLRFRNSLPFFYQKNIALHYKLQKLVKMLN